MTEQEIMELEVGSELNAAVMEVQGCELLDVVTREPCEPGEWNAFWIYPDDSGIRYGHSPSTDIAAAWPLLEELHTKPYLVEVFLVHECENEIKYIVNVLLMHEFTEDLMADRSMISVFSDTAPEAICKAYLLWKEAQDE